MIGLPTHTSSRGCRARSMPASARRSPTSASSASRTAAVISRVAAGFIIDVGDPAHQVLAEADLRVHHARPRPAPRRSADRTDARRSWSSRCRRRGRRRARGSRARRATMPLGPCGRRTVTFQSPCAQRLLQHRAATAGRRSAPSSPHCACQRLLQPLEVAARLVHVGLARPRHSRAGRPDRARSRAPRRACAPPAVDLAVGRHVDDEVALRAGLAATAGARPASPRLRVVALLDGADGGQMLGGASDAVLGELALADLTWQRPQMRAAAADANRYRRRARARACRIGVPSAKAPALAGGHEDDQRIGSAGGFMPGALPRPRAGGRLVAPPPAARRRRRADAPAGSARWPRGTA